MPERTLPCPQKGTHYALLSKYRSELMGLAALWVMLFHAFQLNIGFAPLRLLKSFGYAGVDIFVLLSGMGLCMSFVKRDGEPLRTYFLRRAGRILPAYWLTVGAHMMAN